MASFGHVAAGLLSGRLHGGGKSWGGGEGPAGGGNGRDRRPSSWKTFLLFVALALLPDADLLLVTLGACDNGACGHRGASHSLALALALGLMAGLAARRLGWPVLRTAVATAFAVASHALLDLLGAGGRGLPLLWPFSDLRFVSPIRIFPDAPRGFALLSRPGVINVAIEFAVFLPPDGVRGLAAADGPAGRPRGGPQHPEAAHPHLRRADHGPFARTRADGTWRTRSADPLGRLGTFVKGLGPLGLRLPGKHLPGPGRLRLCVSPRPEPGAEYVLPFRRASLQIG